MIDLNELKNPSKWFRCAPFWSLNDDLKEEELLRQIEQMHQKGYGGFFMHTRVGLVTEYLSDEWMRLINSCAKKAKELDMLAWLYDEDKWPSGFAGGIVPLKSPQFRHKFLALITEDKFEEGDVVLSVLFYKGNKYLVVKRTSKLGDKWFNGTCYIDTLNSDAVAEFINVTHEKYKKECGQYFESSIPGIFTDEPTYLRIHYKDIPTLPWTDDLPKRFFDKKGYNIKEHFEELFFDVGDYQKVRFDFFDIATQMFIENFTIQYAKWCEENNIVMTGHYMAEDTMRGQIEWIGAAMPHYEYMQLPGVDKLARHLEQVITMKQVSSVAEQLGKSRVLCETFGTIGQHVSFLHRKWIADWQAVLGITYINPHLSLYSARGERKRDYPPNLFYQQPWWDDEGLFSDYLARLSYVASAGKREVNVLLIHPICSAWSLYSKFGDDIDKLDKILDMTVKELISSKIDFHFGDETIMSKYAKVENDKIAVGNYQYPVVVLPPLTTLRQSTVELLAQFVQNGGKVVILNDFLYQRFFLNKIEGKEADIPFIKSSYVANDLNELKDILSRLIPNRIEITDKKTGKDAKSVILQKRNLDEKTSIVLIVNTDIKREVNSTIKIPTATNVYAVDLLDFSICNIKTSKVENSTTFIDATLYPSSSLCLLLTSETLEAVDKNVLLTGIAFDNKFEYVKSSSNLEVELLDQNVLLLDKVCYEVEGKKIFENVHVSKLWHEHFYSLPEGTKFKAIYEFEVEKVPQSPLFVVIECAENLDRILVNSHEVKFVRKKNEFSPDENWLDVNFSKIDITSFVNEGKNKIIIEGRKSNNITAPGCHEKVPDPKNHRPTEIEAIYLLGNFSLINVDDTRYIITEPKKPSHIDITKDGYPFYTGSISMIDTINIKKSQGRYYIKLNNLQAASAKVYVNDKLCKVLYWEPFLADITDYIVDGENHIRIVLTNTLFNIMGANNNVDVLDDTYIRPLTFINFERQSDKIILLPFGVSSYTILKGTQF